VGIVAIKNNIQQFGDGVFLYRSLVRASFILEVLLEKGSISEN
jgi:hypothetical protein